MKKLFVSILLMATLGIANSYAQLSPFDENAPVGWASIGLSGGCTGSNNQNPVVVKSEEELRAALQGCKGGKASKTIYISGQIKLGEKLRYDKCSNVTIYGLPGSVLYNYDHSDNADQNPGFYCQDWHNCIIRNVTIKGPGAYDISGCDNISLVGTTNIWIDHCDLQDGMDGNLDAKDKSDNITVSWCKFAYYIAPWPKAGESDDHRCSSMWGSSDGRTETGLNATFVNNWWYHGCGQRCPRIRWGHVHIANCLWENGTEEDPAQYCIGIGHSSKLYVENGDFTKTVLKTGQSNMRGHNKYYLTDKKVYHITLKGNIGEADGQEKGPGDTGDYYNPYTYDTNYKCRVFPASYVADVLRNPDNGAGATLDEDLLTTRGNEHYGEYTPSAIKGIAANDDAQVVGIRYYNQSGAQLAAPQEGLNILVFQMSDGTTRTNKIYK